MRKLQTGVCAALLLGLALAVSGQTRTVTNADLEKYRAERLKAEKELNENYRELGFSSPEEREKRYREYSRQEAQLVEDLRERDIVYAQQDPTPPQYAGPPASYPYPNPNFVDYGGRYAPSYLYYRFYYPGDHRYPGRYDRNRTTYNRFGLPTFEPGRFRTLRRLMREARRGNR